MPKLRIDPSVDKLTGTPQAGDEFEPPMRPAATSGVHAKRTELIPLSRIMPDAFQARIVLPSAIAARFYSGEIDCYSAARSWLELASQDQRVRQRVETLLNLGVSLGAEGQIKNATGSWQRINDQPVFLLETGERRFWGLALQAVQSNSGDEPVLEAVSISEPNRVRQVIENEHSEPPTAVSRARAVAGLINYYHEIYPDEGAYSRYAYHRKALGIRVPMRIWQELERVFRTNRNHLTEYLHLLEMPDDLLDLADDYEISIRRLREIRQYPPEQWESLLSSVISTDSPSSDELQAARSKKTRPSVSPALRSARRIKGILLRLGKGGENDYGPLADWLYSEYDNSQQVMRAAEQLEFLAGQLRVRAEGQI